MKKRMIAASIVALGLAGCMSTTSSGVGQTAANQPISGSLSLRDMGTAGTFTMENLGGRKCSGDIKFDGSQVIRFPIKCSDGNSGTALYTMNSFNQQFSFSYQLQDGETGSVAMGNV